MSRTRVAINGFGRIGRTVARLLLQETELELVAVNDLADIHVMAYLLKYDSVHGKFPGEVIADENAGTITAGGKTFRYLRMKNPAALPWKETAAEVVIECTGHFKNREQASLHLQAGAQKVIISAPPDDGGTSMVVLGVNDELALSDSVISNASCTTNSAAPMIQLLDEALGIENCYITTVHSYTSDQTLHDTPHKDFRRARAGAVSIVPTTTGAAKALSGIFPHLDGKMGGCGIRVPVPDGSLTDLTCTVQKHTTVEEINTMFRVAAATRMKGILEYCEDPIVSVDIINNPHSCIFDARLTSVIGNMVKVVGWYDNESGYSNRLVDLVKLVSVTNGA